MTDETLRLSINLPAIEFRLSQNIQRISHFVAVGFGGPPALLTEPLQLQGSVIAFKYSPVITWSAAEAVAEYHSWVLLNAFRELAELMTHFLSSIQSISTVATIHEIQGPTGHLAPDQWQQLVVNGERRFEKANLPDKLRLLTTEYRLRLEPDVVTHIRSLYSVRNCLVHRAGLVQEADLGEDCVLRAVWLTMRPYVVSEDGEAPLALPHFTTKPSHISIRRELTTKEFALGSRIAFTPAEFNDIAHGGFLAGKAAIFALEQRLREAGIPMSDVSAPSD